MKTLATGLLLLTAFLATACLMKPGGGGCTQTAPDTATAGEPVRINLEFTVWGTGSAIKGRYRTPVVSYRLVGQGAYQTATIKLVTQEEKREVYEVLIPPFAPGVTGELEYSIDTGFDGQLNHIPGTKKIRIG